MIFLLTLFPPSVLIGFHFSTAYWHPVPRNALFLCQEQTRKAELLLLPACTLWELDFLAFGKSQLLLVKGDGDMHFAPLMQCSAQISLNKYLQGNSKSSRSIIHSWST